MKKFDFRRQLKGMNLDSLKQLKSYHLDLMLGFIGLNDESADRELKYLSYIEKAIKTK